MLSFYLLIGLTVVCAALLIIGYKCWDWYGDNIIEGACWLIGLLSVVICICLGCTLIGIENDNQKFIYRYETTKKVLESYDGNYYGNMGDLVKEVIDINKEIAANKALCNDPWRGPWYFEELGELEPLILKPSNNDTPEINN